MVQIHFYIDQVVGLHKPLTGTSLWFVHEAELQYAYLNAQTLERSTEYVTGDFQHDID